MKKNDLAEIKKIDMKALIEKVKKSQTEILNLKLEKNMGKLTNLRVVKNKRKEIAQMLTVINQKKLLERLEENKNA